MELALGFNLEVIPSGVGSMVDEMKGLEGETDRAPYKNLSEWLNEQDLKKLSKESAKAEELFRRVGITFNVYGQKEAEERLIPFDLLPRILSADEWRVLARGRKQRVGAINAFLCEI